MIRCPCGGKTIVKDTRPLDDGIWRRRCCTVCHALQTTFEQACETIPAPRGANSHGTTRSKRKIKPIAPVIIAKSLKSEPPGARAAQAPEVAAGISRHILEDMRMQRELNRTD